MQKAQKQASKPFKQVSRGLAPQKASIALLAVLLMLLAGIPAASAQTMVTDQGDASNLECRHFTVPAPIPNLAGGSASFCIAYPQVVFSDSSVFTVMVSGYAPVATPLALAAFDVFMQAPVTGCSVSEGIESSESTPFGVFYDKAYSVTMTSDQCRGTLVQTFDVATCVAECMRVAHQVNVRTASIENRQLGTLNTALSGTVDLTGALDLTGDFNNNVTGLLDVNATIAAWPVLQGLVDVNVTDWPTLMAILSGETVVDLQNADVTGTFLLDEGFMGTKVGETSTVNVLVLLGIVLVGVFVHGKGRDDDTLFKVVGALVVFVAWFLSLSFLSAWWGTWALSLTILGIGLALAIRTGFDAKNRDFGLDDEEGPDEW